MNKRNLVLSDFYCIKCGKKGLGCYRVKGQERKSGHLKKLYCTFCQADVNHVEIKENTHYRYEDFVNEFEYDNFTEDGTRKMPYGELKGMILNGKIEKKKTLYNDRNQWEW
jgi:hypothetical protein